ncbi:unnamed protein product [marine sediment metagenome]|uniref:Uncharacterized protein n=1 Tax=marine sediment metagenome TaxID=412755 RepID=X1RVP7_9ZZZZ
MYEWIAKYKTVLVGFLVTIGFLIYCYGCEPKVASLVDRARLINRRELQLELDQFITMAQIRMADLDQQDELRAIVLQNALILVQGQPLNPLGIITAVASIYGIMEGGKNITKVVKNSRNKRKGNNGTA